VDEPDFSAEDVFYMPAKEARSWVRLGAFLADLAHYVAWETGRVYTGHTIKVKAEGVICVLKAKHKDNNEVAFFEGETLLRVYQQMWIGLHKDLVKWYPDRYA